MTGGEIVLAIVALVSILGGNNLVAIAALGILAAKALPFPFLFLLVERFGIPTGIVLLTVGLLLPFATGRIGLAAVTQSVLTPTGVVAIAVGALASYLGASGLSLLSLKPQVMVGLIVGSILGVSFLGGVPTGPFVAAGIAAVILRLFRE